jgi:hypothetical protein
MKAPAFRQVNATVSGRENKAQALPGTVNQH